MESLINAVGLLVAAPVCAYVGVVVGEAFRTLDLTPWREEE